jgi:hypothetical protein
LAFDAETAGRAGAGSSARQDAEAFALEKDVSAGGKSGRWRTGSADPMPAIPHDGLSCEDGSCACGVLEAMRGPVGAAGAFPWARRYPSDHVSVCERNYLPSRQLRTLLFLFFFLFLIAIPGGGPVC